MCRIKTKEYLQCLPARGGKCLQCAERNMNGEVCSTTDMRQQSGACTFFILFQLIKNQHENCEEICGSSVSYKPKFFGYLKGTSPSLYPTSTSCFSINGEKKTAFVKLFYCMHSQIQAQNVPHILHCACIKTHKYEQINGTPLRCTVWHKMKNTRTQSCLHYWPTSLKLSTFVRNNWASR